LRHCRSLAPCEFLAYNGRILEKKVKVYIYETEVGTNLLGPAALNKIYIYDGNILGIPEKGLDQKTIVKKAREEGLSVEFNYLDAVVALAVAKIEEAAKLDRKDVNVRITMIKNPSDINVGIAASARRYITSKKKKIRINGPVFIGIRAVIVD